jgi:hypothetical protein
MASALHLRSRRAGPLSGRRQRGFATQVKALMGILLLALWLVPGLLQGLHYLWVPHQWQEVDGRAVAVCAHHGHDGAAEESGPVAAALQRPGTATGSDCRAEGQPTPVGTGGEGPCGRWKAARASNWHTCEIPWPALVQATPAPLSSSGCPSRLMPMRGHVELDQGPASEQGARFRLAPKQSPPQA